MQLIEYSVYVDLYGIIYTKLYFSCMGYSNLFSILYINLELYIIVTCMINMYIIYNNLV